MRNAILEFLVGSRDDVEPGPLRKRMASWVLRSVPGMLTCEQVEAFVYGYHEGTLPEKQRGQFDLHLSLCPMCRVHFDAYVRSVELGRLVFEGDALPEEMPEELVGAILLAADESGD